MKDKSLFDLVLCIESMHCIGNPSSMLKQTKAVLEENKGTLVIADIFEKKEVERIEALMRH